MSHSAIGDVTESRESRLDRPDDGWNRSRRSALVLVLGGAMAMNTFAGFAFGVLGPSLIADFKLTRFELGLATAVFFLVGGSLSLVVGRSVDTWGPKRTLAGSFVLTSTATVGIALSPTYWVFLAFSAAAGVSLAISNPATNKCIAVHVPRGYRGLTMGTKQAGVSIGAVFAGLVLAPLAAGFDWRTALGMTAVIPAILAVATVFTVPADRPIPWAQSGSGTIPASVLWLAAYALLMGSGIAAVNAYFPLFLAERLNAAPSQVGVAVAVIGVLGFLGRVGWGWAADRRHSSSTLLMGLSAGAVGGLVLVTLIEPAGLWLAYPAAAVVGATAASWNSVVMLAAVAAAGKHTGYASGVVISGFYMGFVGSPIAFGWLVDETGSYAIPWVVTAVVFASAAGVVVAWRRREHGDQAWTAR